MICVHRSNANIAIKLLTIVVVHNFEATTNSRKPDVQKSCCTSIAVTAYCYIGLLATSSHYTRYHSELNFLRFV